MTAPAHSRPVRGGGDEVEAPAFKEGDLVDCDGEWEVVPCTYHGPAPNRPGMALVSPVSDPNDGWYAKFEDLTPTKDPRHDP